ncbi:MAG: hypothetical protein WCL02_06705 [bacterium]
MMIIKSTITATNINNPLSPYCPYSFAVACRPVVVVVVTVVVVVFVVVC